MSLSMQYTIDMNKKTNATSKPLYSVHILSSDNTQYTWDFVLQNETSILFAGKTIVQRKKIAKKLYRASELQTKPDFTIETDFSFPCKDYTYLPKQFYVSSHVEVRNSTTRPSQKIITWFSIVAPLLLAIEYKDSLLAAEIFQKKAPLFMCFPVVTMKLLESISVEGLFSWIWGRFDETGMEDLKNIFASKCTKPFEYWGVAEAFFTSARRRLCIGSEKKESLDECMARYLKTHPGTKLTVGIVGSNHYRWVEKNLYHSSENNINSKEMFTNTNSIIQAETDNKYDENALAVYFENFISGYIRKTGASLLRNAFPNKTQFTSSLARLGYSQGGSTGIVVEIVV